MTTWDLRLQIDQYGNPDIDLVPNTTKIIGNYSVSQNPDFTSILQVTIGLRWGPPQLSAARALCMEQHCRAVFCCKAFPFNDALNVCKILVTLTFTSSAQVGGRLFSFVHFESPGPFQVSLSFLTAQVSLSFLTAHSTQNQ